MFEALALHTTTNFATTSHWKMLYFSYQK